MQLIWFNPDNQSYHTGRRIDYEVQKSLARRKEDFVILDELQGSEERLAVKIAARLNQAFAEYAL